MPGRRRSQAGAGLGALLLGEHHRSAAEGGRTRDDRENGDRGTLWWSILLYAPQPSCTVSHLSSPGEVLSVAQLIPSGVFVTSVGPVDVFRVVEGPGASTAAVRGEPGQGRVLT